MQQVVTRYPIVIAQPFSREPLPPANARLPLTIGNTAGPRTERGGISTESARHSEQIHAPADLGHRNLYTFR